MPFIYKKYSDHFTGPEPGRTMSRDFAFKMILQDARETVKNLDSQVDEDNLKEAIEILEEQLDRSFYSDTAGKMKAVAWRSGYEWHVQVEGYPINHGDSFLTHNSIPNDMIDVWIKARPWLSVRKAK